MSHQNLGAYRNGNGRNLMKSVFAHFACLVCSAWLDAAVRYVNVTSVTRVRYTNAAAATIIQDAIDIALPGDDVVTNGAAEPAVGLFSDR
jgi:hypothetical protein